MTINLEIRFKASVSGSFEISYTHKTCTTYKTKGNQLVSKNVQDLGRNVTGTLKVSAKAGLEVALKIYVTVVPVLSFEAFGGIKGAISLSESFTWDDSDSASGMKIFNINQIDCIVAEISIVLELSLKVVPGTFLETQVWGKEWELPIFELHFHLLPNELVKDESKPLQYRWGPKKDNFHKAEECPYENSKITFSCVYADGSTKTAGIIGDLEQGTVVKKDEFPPLEDNEGLIKGYRFDNWYLAKNTERAVDWTKLLKKIDYKDYTWEDFTLAGDEVAVDRDLTLFGKLIPVQKVHIAYRIKGSSELTFTEGLLDQGETFTLSETGLKAKNTDHNIPITDEIDNVGWFMVEDFRSFTPIKEISAGKKVEVEDKDIYLLSLGSDDILATFYGADDKQTTTASFTSVGGSLSAPDASSLSLIHYQFKGWQDKNGRRIAFPITAYEDHWQDADGKLGSYDSVNGSQQKLLFFTGEWEYDPNMAVTAQNVDQMIGKSLSDSALQATMVTDPNCYNYSFADTEHTKVTITGLKTEAAGSAPYYLVIPKVITTADGKEYSVVGIGASAFAGNKDIRAVRFEYGSRVTSIGASAFSGCTNLLQADLSACTGLSSLSDNLFDGCTGLRCVIPAQGVNSIGERCFYNCYNISQAKLNADIGADAFMKCSGITNLELGRGVTSIQEYAFSYCTGLTKVEVPDSVATLGNGFLSFCTNVTELTINGSPKQLTSGMLNIGEGSRLQKLVLKAGITELGDSALTNGGFWFLHLTELELPSTLKRFGVNCFGGVRIEKLTIPTTDTLAVISKSAFAGLSSLKELTIQGGSIEEEAFKGCTALTTLNLGPKVSKIGAKVFEGCTSLVTVDMSKCASLGEVGNEAFKDCTALETILFPDTVTTYGNHILAGCSSLRKIHVGISGGVLTAAAGVSPFYIGTPNSLQTIELSESLTTVGKGMFANSTSTNDADLINAAGFASLGTLKLPAKLASIGDYAFYRAGSQQVQWPEYLSSIGKYAFAGSGLTNLDLKGDNLKIGEYAFANMPALTGLTLRSGVYQVGGYAFSGCGMLSSVHMEECDTLQSVGDQAFAGCTGLAELIFSDSISAYGDKIISGCTGLTHLSVGSSTGYLAAGSTSASPFYIGESNQLRSLTIRDGVSAIGDYLFANGTTTSAAGFGFTHLNTLSLPSTLSSIGSYAFYKAGTCGQLPASLETIGDYAFAYGGGISTMNLKGSGLSVGNYAFAGMYVKDLIITEGVSSLGDGAFSGCGSLETADMSGASSLSSVGSRAFQNCGKLKSLVFPENMGSYGAEVVSGCAALEYLAIGLSGGTLSASGGISPFYIGENNSLRTLVILEGVKGIEEGLFANSRYTSGAASGYGFTGLTSLTLPVTLETIGRYAFFRAGMKTLKIPASLCSMGEYAFSQAGIQVLTLYGNQLEIGPYAFADDNALLNVSIEEGVTSLGTGAFARSASLRKVNMSACDTLRTVSDQVFISCPMLKVLVFPDSVTSYGDRLIEGDSALEDLYVGFAGGTLQPAGGENAAPFYIGETNSLKRLTIGKGITSIASCLFSNYTDTKITNGTYGTGFPGLEQINLPESLTEIGEYTFYRSGSYVLNLPANIRSIGSHAFAYANKITELNLSGNDLDIGIYAFAYLPMLQTVTVRDGVRSIGNYAFDNSPMLRTVDMSGCSTLTTVNGYLFRNCAALKSLSFPASVTYYGDEIIVGCTALENLAVGFNGVITSSKGTSYSPFYIGKTNALKHIVIVEGTTGVGDCIFANYTKTLSTDYAKFNGFANLESITMPSTLKTIGNYAFYKGASRELNFPAGLESIGDYAFYYIDRLTDLTLKGTNLNIGTYAFAHATQLTKVRAMDGVVSIGNYAFSSCPMLLSANLQSSSTLTTVNGNAFERCTALKSISFPDSMTTYGTHIIYADTALESIRIGAAGELKQGSGTWSPFFIGSKTAVKEMIIGETVTSIVDGLLNNYSSTSPTYANRGYGYKNLQRLVLPSSLVSMGEYTFYNAGASTSLTVYSNLYNERIATFAEADGHTYVYNGYPDFTLTLVNPAASQRVTCAVTWGSLMTPISWNGDNTGVTVSDISTWQNILTVPETEGYAFEAWYLDEACTQPLLGNCIPYGDVTLYAHMLREGTLTLLLEDEDGNYAPYQTMTVLEGAYVNPEPGIREGRTFEAWYKDEARAEKWNPNADLMPGEDLTLYGGFVPMQTVTFLIATESRLYMRGSEVYDAFTDYASLRVERGGAVQAPEEPDIDGYIFSGWFEDSNFVKEWEEENIGNTDVTIYGRLRRKTSGGLYRAVSGGYELTRYAMEEDESSEVYLPAKYLGQPVVSIADNAFAGTEITVLHLPENLASIGQHTFSGATNLRALRISRNNTHFSTSGGLLLSKDGTVLYSCPVMAASGSFRLMDGIREIKPYAFEDHIHLKEIYLPDSVTKLGSSAFKGCSEMTLFSAYGLTEIGAGALPISSSLRVEGPLGSGALRNYCYAAGDDPENLVGTSSGYEMVILYNIHYVDLYLDGVLRGKIGAEAGVLLDSELQHAEVDGGVITSGWFRDEGMTDEWNFAADKMPTRDIALYSTTRSIYSWTLSEDGNSVTLTGYYGKGGSVVLPDQIEGKPVTEIADGFLATANGTVRAITIPSTVTTIGDNALTGSSAYPFSGTILCDANSYAYQWGTEHGLISSNRTYILSFETNGGAAIASREAAAGAAIRVRDAVRSNSTFEGWFLDAAFEQPMETDEDGLFVMPGHDTTLFAKWLEEIPVYDFEWTEEADGITITSYTANQREVEIPESINGVNVVRIGNGAFEGNSTLSRIELPATVKYIGEDAFRDTELVSASLGGTISVGSDAFRGCEILRTVEMNQVKVIGEYAFSGCTMLNDLNLPETLLTISARAFEYCTSLTQVILPNSVTAVGNGAFYHCSGMTQATIGSGCFELSPGAWVGCDRLEAILTASGNNYYQSNNGVLLSRDGKTLVSYPAGKQAETYTIPQGVTAIGASAFENTRYLKKVVLNASLTEIGESAFKDCAAIEEIDFSASSALTVIRDSAMSGCVRLTEAVLPGSVTEIGAAAFLGCASLKSLTISDQVTKIGTSAIPASNEALVVYCSYGSTAWNYAAENDIAHSDPNRVDATGAEIHGETAIMTRGSTQQLTLTIEPANASETKVTWFADSAILLVSDTGFVSALSSGSATVYAVLENGITASYPIEVAVPVLSISDEQTERELAVGEQISLEPTLLPAAAIERKLTWTSANPGVAAVDESGTVTGVNAGETTITAVTESGLTLTYTFLVRIHLESLQLSAENICLTTGQRVRFGIAQSVPALPAGSELPLTISMDTAGIVTVDETGLITAISAGEVTLTVTIEGNEEISAVCHVQVKQQMSRMNLPAALREVEEEAFSGIPAETVVIPAGTVSIGNRAFAGSTLQQVYLPASLESIAQDAFSGTNVLILCPAGSRAETYAREHGIRYMIRAD